MSERFEDVTEENKLRHWRQLETTDPKHTKPFQRAGGFRGTAIRPIWNQYRLTEHFGPCGVGWGTDKPEFTTIDAGGELLVFCILKCWYMDEDGKRAELYGIGGDKVLVKRQAGLSTDDEAFKKAFTDALGNAFLRIGVSADVHMGLFDDSKYVDGARRQFPSPETDGPQEASQRPATRPSSRGVTRTATPKTPAPAPAAAAKNGFGSTPKWIEDFLVRESYEIDPQKAGGWSSWEKAYLNICDYATDIDQVTKLEQDNGAYFAGFRETVKKEVYEHFRARVSGNEKRLWPEPDASLDYEMSGGAA